APLKHSNEVFCFIERVLSRRVNGLVHGTVLGAMATVGVKRGGGKAVCRHDVDPSSLRVEALTHGFGETDGARDTDIQALYRAQHGNLHELIADFASKTTHALALCAHDPCHAALCVNLVQIRLSLVIGAHQPDVALFERAHRTRQIGDHD